MARGCASFSNTIQCSLSQPCKACVSMGFECTFFQPQKKRGPTGHRVSQIRQQQTHVLSKTPQTPQDQVNSSAFSNTFTYQTEPPPCEESRHDATPWPIHGSEVSVPVDIAQSHATAAVAPGWGVDASSMTSHSNSAISWNERSDVEYWLPDNLDAQMPIFDFPGTNIYLRTSLPSIIQNDADSSGLQAQNLESHNIPAPIPDVDVIKQEPNNMRALWPSSIVEANMIPWIDVYFDRLHPTLPVLNRSSLFIRMLSQEHRRNPQFGSMLLSLCAFSLTQPIEIDERPTSQSRAGQARLMMTEATRMRSCSDFGENPTIEAVLTSFFLFGCLFGSNQHNAAWLRLREALDLAATLGLNDPNSYRDLPSDEKGQRLRTYLVLSITERAYALQRRHPITFWGKPGFSMCSVHDFIHNATHSLVSGIIVHNEKDAEGMMGLARLMELFDAVNEDVVDCWNRRCSIDSGYCERLTEAKALAIHQNLSRVSESERYKGYDWFERTKSASGETRNTQPAMGLRETQCADVFITKKWLQNRVWVLCSTHGLLKPSSDHHELCFDYCISVAKDTLKICQSLRLSSMEAHGIGLVEKLYDIAVSAISVSSNVQLSLGNGFPLAPPPTQTVPKSGVSTPSFSGPIHPGAAATLPQSLAEDFLLLLNSLRGGNHPYLERYKAFLNASNIRCNSYSNWSPQVQATHTTSGT
ncbi:hypothetical protein BDV23DRAFT_158212 [Aspergillus alliaceus]|uniref:Xylanolytic transcriptional activator regulatory domain-containing protein n=1 Tax=Petromyces alliaceus TaxID=209559 RepID=A0A5N7C459_PETAA|nr:hypothetical protein BDV23DRAFT_158212 [Aspergillus alliaceus]